MFFCISAFPHFQVTKTYYPLFHTKSDGKPLKRDMKQFFCIGYVRYVFPYFRISAFQSNVSNILKIRWWAAGEDWSINIWQCRVEHLLWVLASVLMWLMLEFWWKNQSTTQNKQRRSEHSTRSRPARWAHARPTATSNTPRSNTRDIAARDHVPRLLVAFIHQGHRLVRGHIYINMPVSPEVRWEMINFSMKLLTKGSSRQAHAWVFLHTSFIHCRRRRVKLS